MLTLQCRSHKQTLEYINAIESFNEHELDDATATVLFMTFSHKPDHGVQQAVLRALGHFSLEVYYRAFFLNIRHLMEIRLIDVDMDWDLILLQHPTIELKQKDLEIIAREFHELDLEEDARKKVIDLVNRRDVVDEHGWATVLVKLLSKQVER